MAKRVIEVETSTDEKLEYSEFNLIKLVLFLPFCLSGGVKNSPLHKPKRCLKELCCLSFKNIVSKFDSEFYMVVKR